MEVEENAVHFLTLYKLQYIQNFSMYTSLNKIYTSLHATVYSVYLFLMQIKVLVDVWELPHKIGVYCIEWQ